ncbi:aminotransferase-like domain-containing protein [Kaistia sp. MMO-174]|uniref:aminotransferase-like domain-containing protein n=1 Tax=Kaistia sp. MMO-174 TaxID=3081256 RepID=UPI0030180D58
MASAKTNKARPATAQWLRSSNDISQQFLAFGGRADVVSLAGGLPAAELYPVADVEAAARSAIARHGSTIMEYGPVEGLPALRQLIAARVAAETGGNFTAANVLLTTGSMQALDLIGKVLVDQGELIVAQAPTYLGALDAWRPRAPSYLPLDWTLQDPGFDAALEKAKFVYSVPNYSNPTGVLVSQERRVALLDKVLAAGTWLVEDDPYLSIQLDGSPGPSILSHSVARSTSPGPYDGPVIYLGTVSKSLVPGLRVGWVVAEAGMIQNLALTKMASDLSGSLLTQAIALELMQRDFDHEHSSAIVPVYRERRDALLREAALRLSDWFEWEVPVGGMFVWMRSKDSAIDTDALYKFAVEEKVAYVPSSVFDFTGENRFAMRVNFTRSSPEVIAEGVRRLARAVEHYLSARQQLEGAA